MDLIARFIPPQYRLAAKVVGFVLAVGLLLVLGFAAGHEWSDRHWKAVTEKANAKAAKDLADAQADARRAEREHIESVNEIEAKHHAENERAKAAYDRLLDDYRDGTIRLRSRFTCPAQPVGVPGAATGTGVSQPAPSGGLQAADVRTLVRIADEADAVVRQLSACQAILQADRKR